MTALALKQEEKTSSFADLASSIRLKGAVAMLTAYLDESGTHVEGRLKALTIAGAIADVKAWQALEEDWNLALGARGLAALHMRELALVPDRGDLVGEFAAIIAKHTPSLVSYTSTVVDRTEDMYEASFVDALMSVANLSVRVGPINVMAAKHPEFKRGTKFFDLINWGDARLGLIAFGDPREVIPLQAADLIAHQVRRGAKALRDAGCTVFKWRDGLPEV